MEGAQFLAHKVSISLVLSDACPCLPRLYLGADDCGVLRITVRGVSCSEVDGLRCLL